MGLTLLIVLVCLIVLCLPTWPYSREWGYRPTGLVSFILFVILILILADVIALWKVEVHSDNNKTTIKIEKQEH